MKLALLAAVLLAACGGDDDCPHTLPIRSETGALHMIYGVGVIRDDGTPDGCLSWSDGEEVHDYRYRQQWGVSPDDGQE